jgi:hypothetical protein
MGARIRVGIGLSHWPARLHMLAELISLESILGLLKSLKIRALYTVYSNPSLVNVVWIYSLALTSRGKHFN